MTLMLEIVIPRPENSRYPANLRRYSADRLEEFTTRAYFLQRWEITPQTHPMAADVFAGDGSMAWLLHQLGWRPENITCIDMVVTPTPLVEGVNWEYWDLQALSLALLVGKVLPLEVQAYQSYFDVVMMAQGAIGSAEQVAVAEFLTQPGGKWFW